MNQIEARKHAAELVIALCLCGGGWYFLVQPAQHNLAAARAEIATLEAQKSAWAANDLPADQARDMLSEAAGRAKVIDQRSAPARDQSLMFSVVMDLAARHDIRVDQLAPGGRRNTNEVAKAPLDPNAPVVVPLNDTAVSYTLAITSTYGGLAGFLADLQSQAGYSVVKTVRFSPADTAEDQMVTATVTTEHLAFDTASVWKAIAAAPQTAVAPVVEHPAAPATAPATATVPSGE